MNASVLGLFQIIGGMFGGSVIITLVTVLTNRRKMLAETESLSVATANSLLVNMRGDIEDLRGRLARQESTISAYGRRVEYLTALLTHNNIAVRDWDAPA